MEKVSKGREEKRDQCHRRVIDILFNSVVDEQSIRQKIYSQIHR